MDINIKVDVTSHKKEYIDAKDDAVEKALEMCGMEMERRAAGLSNVDTGLQRNSISYALDGKSPSKGSYVADNPKPGKKSSGSYSGAVPKESEGVRSVTVGTNVEYAIYNELGSSRHPAANGGRGFLKPAVQDNTAVYTKIIQQCISEIK